MTMLQTRDVMSLRAITPVALSAYARSEGWDTAGTYRQHSDVYAGDGKPEIIVPRTDVIDDYAMVVQDLISIFARVLGRDEVSIFRDLTLADRDVLRVRAIGDYPSGLPFENSCGLMDHTRDMLAAAANSLDDNRPVYRTGSNGKAANYLQSIRLNQTEGGSFSLVLVSPALAPKLFSQTDPMESSFERRVAQRLSESLYATRSASEHAVSGNGAVFGQMIESGVSANLCEAVAGLVESVDRFDVSFSWALARPTAEQRGPVTFSRPDGLLLREAARGFRSLEPQYDQHLHGFIYSLARPYEDDEGTVRLRTHLAGARRSVTAVLNRFDYPRAIEAHAAGAMVSLSGDLERIGQTWHLRRAKLIEILPPPETIQPPLFADFQRITASDDQTI